MCLHDAGLHATLAGVILAVVTPTRPPANLHALMTQAQLVIQTETRYAGDAVMHHGLSAPALRMLDTIHDRLESPADKLLRSIEPWSSFAVLPLFAFANAGVVWSTEVVSGHGRLILAIVLGLVVGKPLGIFLCSKLAVLLGFAVKPERTRGVNWPGRAHSPASASRCPYSLRTRHFHRRLISRRRKSASSSPRSSRPAPGSRSSGVEPSQAKQMDSVAELWGTSYWPGWSPANRNVFPVWILA